MQFELFSVSFADHLPQVLPILGNDKLSGEKSTKTVSQSPESQMLSAL